MPKAFTDREKDVIGKRLLDHGYKQFSAYGLGKTNVEEIALAAGISKGAFYGFYGSKEALFMDVIEQAEVRLRQEIMAVIDLPGPSPRARLFVALKKAFGLFDEMPILRSFTGPDFEVLFRRMPPEILRDHLDADRLFMQELVDHCRAVGIPIRVGPEEITGLLYPVVLAVLHKDDLGPAAFGGNVDVLLELIAAFCLGEVRPSLTAPNPGVAGLQEEKIRT